MARHAIVERWLTEQGLQTLTGWARRGLTDDQIAKNIGCNRKTIYDWKKKYPAIRDALSLGKEAADLVVENALYKRAIGYTVKETTSYRDKDSGEMVVAKEVIKEIAPDTTAQIYWLKNRRPGDWRDRPVHAGESTETQVAAFLEALNDAVTQPVEQNGAADEDGGDT